MTRPNNSNKGTLFSNLVLRKMANPKKIHLYNRFNFKKQKLSQTRILNPNLFYLQQILCCPGRINF